MNGLGTKDKSVPWYAPELDLQPTARQVLEDYSHIPPDEVEAHVLALRDKAWDIFPYPCVGEFGFLDFNLCHRPSYPQILHRLKSDPSAHHLDVGCCLGQDIRKLVLDGAPSSQITGLELETDFINLGYALFRDQHSLRTKFHIADLLGENPVFETMQGSFASVHIGLVLHLFTLEEQKGVLRRLIGLLAPRGVIVGHCVAHVEGVALPAMEGKMTMRHNVETWRELWRELGEETGDEFVVFEELRGFVRGGKYASWRDDGKRVLVFEVRRGGG